jgi:hypothetical protein
MDGQADLDPAPQMFLMHDLVAFCGDRRCWHYPQHGSCHEEHG